MTYLVLILFVFSTGYLFMNDTDESPFAPLILMLLFISAFGISGLSYRLGWENKEKLEIKSHQPNQILYVDSAKVEMRNDTIYMSLKYHKP